MSVIFDQKISEVFIQNFMHKLCMHILYLPTIRRRIDFDDAE
jgi:hypothetical protein